MKDINKWYEEWFNSCHYHVLYKHRDGIEAECFIGRLFNHLPLDPTKTKVLDLACGKGRHAIQVHELGYDVCGVDLSQENINEARKSETEGLKFFIGDMRNLQLDRKFDLVLNLFTSFGYFETDEENKNVIQSVSDNLNLGGIMVLDYLNVELAIKELPSSESIEIDNTLFTVNKSVKGDFICKSIQFEDQGKKEHFQEYVKRITLSKFTEYFGQAGMKLIDVFGSYELGKYEQDKSDRLILIAQKLAYDDLL